MKFTWDNVKQYLDEIYPSSITNKAIAKHFAVDYSKAAAMTALIYDAGEIERLAAKGPIVAHLYRSNIYD